MNFALRLRQARKEVGLSQVEMGQRIGVSGQSVKEWEAGRSYPQFDRLEAIAEVTGKPIPWFFLSYEEDLPVTDMSSLRLSLEELERIDSAVRRLKERLLSLARREGEHCPWSEYRPWAEAKLARLAGEVSTTDFAFLVDELARSRWEFLRESRSKAEGSASDVAWLHSDSEVS